MHTRIYSADLWGITAELVEVECDISAGLVQFNIVGLPDKVVRESKDRIKAALRNCGFKTPERLITINLAPAGTKKQSSAFDLPIAVAVLTASGAVSSALDLDKTIFLGELSLDGSVRKVNGVLPTLRKAAKGFDVAVVPADNFDEAVFSGIQRVAPVKDLNDVLDVLTGKVEPAIAEIPVWSPGRSDGGKVEEVIGQDDAKLAIEAAAAGMHNLLMIGPPGTGKTMLAERIMPLLPPLEFSEALEVSEIYSSIGLLEEGRLMTERPFRTPHHTVSQAGLIGGGTTPRPGEISLAHRGVLFLDEIAEFQRSALEALRQPLESGTVTISRANRTETYPADFLLVAAMNPCPCGYMGTPRCTCTPAAAERYMKKLSGPLIDRVDIHVPTKYIPAELLDEYKEKSRASERFNTAAMVGRVDRAVEKMKERGQTRPNGKLSGEEIKRFARPSKEAARELRDVFRRLGLSMRSYHKLVKVARTLADLEGEELIRKEHVVQASSLRIMDRI